MGKRRIAFLGIKALPANAGIDTVVEAIVQRLNYKQYQPVVYVDARKVPKENIFLGVEIIRIWTFPGKYLNATSLYLFAALHAIILGKFDLINVHCVEACFVLPILRLRYKVLSTAHGLLSKEPENLSKWGIAQHLFWLTEIPFMYFSNARTCVSKTIQDYLESRYKRDVVLITNAVTDIYLETSAAQNTLDEFQLTKGGYLLFTAGRLIPIKGCDLLLEAFKEIKDDVKLVIIGGLGHVTEYDKRLINLIKSDKRVHFLGFVEDKILLFGLIKLARLFIFPTYYEGMAMTMLEVAALGTPLLASDISENQAILPDQALFFQTGNPVDLQEKLKWALSHPSDMTELAQKGQLHVFRNFQWEQVVRKYEEHYETLLSENRGAK